MKLSEKSFAFPPAGVEKEFEMSREKKARKPGGSQVGTDGSRVKGSWQWG